MPKEITSLFYPEILHPYDGHHPKAFTLKKEEINQDQLHEDGFLSEWFFWKLNTL